MEDDIKNTNLYELLNIPESAQNDEIKKAYRKKALTCHPDKNPDNPNAAKLFHQLTKVLEILLDEKARAAYDKVLKAKHAAKIRNKELDSERRKFKEALEKQELLAERERDQSNEQKLQREIDRLRKEGMKQAAEESERLRKLLLEQLQEAYCNNSRIKVTWKANKKDPNNGGYDEETLENIFSKYGKVEALVVSGKKNGSALIEMESPEAANNAVIIETGLPTNPLNLKIIGSVNEKKKPKSNLSDPDTTPLVDESNNVLEINDSEQSSSFGSQPLTFTATSAFSKATGSIYEETEDFEKEVLKRLKRCAEEQKKK